MFFDARKSDKELFSPCQSIAIRDKREAVPFEEVAQMGLTVGLNADEIAPPMEPTDAMISTETKKA